MVGIRVGYSAVGAHAEPLCIHTGVVGYPLVRPSAASESGAWCAPQWTLLHKCANPACVNPFRKLSGGKLFRIEMHSSQSLNRNGRNWDEPTPHRIEHFWLCHQCASVLILSFDLSKSRLMSVKFASGGAPTPRKPVMLFEDKREWGGYDVAADGRFAVVREAENKSTGNPINVVLHWFDEVKRAAQE